MTADPTRSPTVRSRGGSGKQRQCADQGKGQRVPSRQRFSRSGSLLPVMIGAPASASKWPMGTVVKAKVKGWKKYFPGKISAYDPKTGLYTVNFDDGDVKQTKAYNIKAQKKDEVLKAPDGTEFKTKAEYRTYMKSFLSFKEKTGETLVRKPGQVAGQSFSISDLKQCTVRVMDFCDQVLVDRVEDCHMVIGPSSNSVFVRNAKNCTLYIACKQFRSRDCVNCTISLYSKTEPVVETSSNMRFYPYAASYPGQAALFTKASLVPDLNHWANVYDFNKGDGRYPEPHWETVEDTSKWEAIAVPVEGMGEPENPVPSSARAKPVAKEMGEFNFNTSQEQAAAVHEAADTASTINAISKDPEAAKAAAEVARMAISAQPPQAATPASSTPPATTTAAAAAPAAAAGAAAAPATAGATQ